MPWCAVPGRGQRGALPRGEVLEPVPRRFVRQGQSGADLGPQNSRLRVQVRGDRRGPVTGRRDDESREENTLGYINKRIIFPSFCSPFSCSAPNDPFKVVDGFKYV